MGKHNSTQADQQGSGQESSASGAGQSELVDQAQHMTDQAQATVGRLASTLRQQATSRIDQQLEKVAGGLDTLSLALQTTASQVRQQDNEQFAKYVEQAAQRLEQFSDNMRQGNVTERVEQVARQRPGLFLGVTLGTGLVVSRFFRTSARGQEQKEREREEAKRRDEERIRQEEERRRAEEAVQRANQARKSQQDRQAEQAGVGAASGEMASAYAADDLLSGVGADVDVPVASGYLGDASGLAADDTFPLADIDPVGLDPAGLAVEGDLALGYAEADATLDPTADPGTRRS